MSRVRSALCATMVAAVTFPAAAHATLVYDKGTLSKSPSVWAAQNDGGSPHRLGAGRSPDISPDGRTVVWSDAGLRHPKLIASPTGAAAPKTLLSSWEGDGMLAWAPASTSLATVVGPGTGATSLVIVDISTLARTTVATGHFGGVSFSPTGDRLVYAKGQQDDQRLDLYVYDIAAGTTTRLTSGSRSGSPLWGPDGIVFTRSVDASVRRYGPKGELYTIDGDGKHLTRLTHQPVPQLQFGLRPTAFSADGRRLLGQFTGQDTSYAQVVNPATGKVRTLGPSGENGLEGLALSRDGRTVLAATGGFGPATRHDIVTIRYAGGPARVLVRNSSGADWNR